MNDDKRIEYETRDSILKLLTDEEIARVSTAETAPHLTEGDEYVDLEKLARGVQRAGPPRSTTGSMGRVLPKKAVQEGTWTAILERLGKSGVATDTRNGTSHNGAAAAKARFVILAAVDDSDSALEVVSAASGFARLIQGASVHLLYVVEHLGGLEAIGTVPVDVQKEAFERGRLRLDDLGREIRAHTNARTAAHVVIGRPWREIVQTATDLGADLVLVGTHDRAGIASAILGSVAQDVARKAPCPVLVVRPKRPRHEDVPEIEPPCPDCQRVQTESGGKELWCARHREHHAIAHCYYEVPESFALGSMLIRE